MNLILTMAGRYTRFTKEGYKIPKYLLPWGAHTILAEILYSMTISEDNIDNMNFKEIYLIANERDIGYFPHIYQLMKKHGIPERNLIAIGDTSGQAQTAIIGLEKIESIRKISGPVLFHNIDTILHSRNYKTIENELFKNDGYVDLFRSNNREYSYVLLDKNNRITELAEKILISDLATSGLYGFSSIDIFKKYCANSNYISEVYSNMNEDGLRSIGGSPYSEKQTLVLGTPVEYLNLSKTIKY